MITEEQQAKLDNWFQYHNPNDHSTLCADDLGNHYDAIRAAGKVSPKRSRG